MNEWILILLPGILTVVLNVIFYLVIKRSVEKSMEKFKIAYSGIFSEKIRIYQRLLKKTSVIKRQIRNYSFKSGNIDSSIIQKKIMDFHYFTEANAPFISKDLMNSFQQLHVEYKSIFTPIYFYSEGNNSDRWDKEYRESVKKIQKNEAFKILEEKIIIEMRKELRTDNP